ncbi:unnamed protein product [Rhizophagus irregularis]|nr:unnamed protein product [Rhizophagus irregularis]
MPQKGIGKKVFNDHHHVPAQRSKEVTVTQPFCKLIIHLEFQNFEVILYSQIYFNETFKLYNQRILFRNFNKYSSNF